jgi:hypothetical protein
MLLQVSLNLPTRCGHLLLFSNIFLALEPKLAQIIFKSSVRTAKKTILSSSLGLIALMMEAVNTSETSVNYRAVLRDIPEDSHLN